MITVRNVAFSFDPLQWMDEWARNLWQLITSSYLSMLAFMFLLLILAILLAVGMARSSKRKSPGKDLLHGYPRDRIEESVSYQCDNCKGIVSKYATICPRCGSVFG